MVTKILAQLRLGLAILSVVIIIGTFGFEIIQPDWSILDSFYMTIISITTTGFKEVKPLTTSGRIFTIFLIISGVLTIAYTGGKAAQILIEKQILRRRRMNRNLGMIKNHYIVCGYGRMGKQICESLKDSNEKFVVVENDPEKIETLIDKNFLFVVGDASNDEVLLKAGIKTAKGLVSVIKSDAENVFTTLSAKELNKDVFVVSRAIEEGTESKLLRAGANRVVKPYELGGTRMVQLLLRPGVIDFIDGVARNKGRAISLEEIHVMSNSELIGKSLMNSPIRKNLNIIIVAIYRHGGEFIYNPTSSTEFEVDDTLIAIGETKDLQLLTELCLN